jgi:hypothetical protein
MFADCRGQHKAHACPPAISSWSCLRCGHPYEERGTSDRGDQATPGSATRTQQRGLRAIGRRSGRARRLMHFRRSSPGTSTRPVPRSRDRPRHATYACMRRTRRAKRRRDGPARPSGVAVRDPRDAALARSASEDAHAWLYRSPWRQRGVEDGHREWVKKPSDFCGRSASTVL